MCISYFNIWGYNSLLTRKDILYSLPFINMKNINVANKMDYIKRKKITNLPWVRKANPILEYDVRDKRMRKFSLHLSFKNEERERERESYLLQQLYFWGRFRIFFFKGNRHSRLFPVILSSHHLKLVCFYFYSEKWRASVDSVYLDL